MKSEKNIKQKNVSRRFIIAMIYFIIAIILAILEFFIMKSDLVTFNFFAIVAAAVIYPIYYALISTTIEDCKIWPLAVLMILLEVFCTIEYYVNTNLNIICEILEIILFISQIITAIFIKIKDAKKDLHVN